MASDPVITLVSALVLSYVFVVAGMHKIHHLPEFLATLKNYQLFPDFLLLPVCLLVPVLELAAGVGLLMPHSTPPAAMLAALLLCFYIVAILINLLRDRRDIDCGCLGPSQRQGLSEWLVLRNMLLFGLACLAMQAGAQRELAGFDWLVVVLATALACLCYNIGNQLLVNQEKLKLLRSDHA